MNIIVLVKQVPDTETKIVVKPGEKTIDKTGVNFIVNPYDEFAIEEALRIREKLGEGTVTLITMGPHGAETALRTGLAMGADAAVHLRDDSFNGSDPLASATALARAIQGMEYDLILCGKQAIDDDSAQVGPAIAELLGLPQVTFITKLEINPDREGAIVHREVEGTTEVLEIPLPAVLTCQKGLNEPRYPSLIGIKRATKKEIKLLDTNALGLERSQVGEAGSRTRITEMFTPPPRKAGKIIDGETPADKARELVKLLHEEAKVV